VHRGKLVQVSSRSEDPEITRPEAAEAAPGELLLVVGSSQLITHAITGDEVVIGRAPGCDLVLDHRALSRRHAVLRRRPGLTVQDLGSMNGVRTSRGIVRGGGPVPLAPGESFHIGPFAFLVVDAQPADPSSHRSGRDRLVVEDPSPDGVSALVREIARSGVNVLVLGETGVGKEVLATSLHALSERSGPLSSINCAALSEPLLESELFGHDKGAFTGAVGARPGLFEATDGGTVFLDEIGELPLALQAKLLRAVESREIRRLGSTRSIPIDVRIIAATNRDLAGEVAAGRFRQDLFFRLDGVTLRIPPLRARPHAIGPLALRFIAEAAQRLGRPDVRATPELLVALAAHDWPGNVRELKAVIDRAVLLSRGAQLGSRHLAFSQRSDEQVAASPPGSREEQPAAALARAARRPSAPGASAAPPTAERDRHAPATAGAAAMHGGDELDFLDAEQRADRARVVAALDECAGNQTRAAKRLGIARTTLVNRLALYRIPRPRT
jgi:two-component system, NtrC family, response regulator AtoC